MHHNHQQPPKPHIHTNYLSVPQKDLEYPRSPFSVYVSARQCDPDQSVYRADRALSVTFWKYVPFVLHFVLTAIVAAVCLFSLDGRAFHTSSRRPEYPEPDGTLHRVAAYTPLQSDIATAISVAATATRVTAGWWAGGCLWRAIFVSMERGGISLEGLSRVVSNMPPAPRHFGRKSNMVIIFIILFATYATDYFSAALNGAITWEPAYDLQPGRIQVTGIKRGVGGEDMWGYYKYPEDRASIVEIGTSSSNLAWVTTQPNSTNITEPSTTFRRILKEAQYLPVNSTLDNITMPYFVVDAFQWIKDPDPVLKNKQLPLFEGNKEFNPYVWAAGMGGLLPDVRWGPPQINTLGDPHIVSETRLFTFRTERRPWADGPCPQNYLIDPGWEINLHQVDNGAKFKSYDCHAIANITYRAGAAVCHDCKIIAPIVVEAPAAHLELIPDSFTSMALGLAPSLGTYLLYSGFAIPQNYGTRKNFVIEMTSRTYQAAWAAYSSKYNATQGDATYVKIALPALRAKVFPGKVFIWVFLHLGVLVFGFLFVVIHSRCDHPWAENPTMALFWLDASAVSGIPVGSSGDGIELDPWRPGTEFRRDGMLLLEKKTDNHAWWRLRPKRTRITPYMP